ncbi:MAG TPA: efflux RND transporter periplasmic adaptor subunit, partial [Bacteroidales bacterium]|nr:efflux RND transporter periplasmic adaptor subunit [Bacteroidales bacterium]
MRKANLIFMLLAVVTGCNHRGTDVPLTRAAINVRIQTVEGSKTAGILSYVGTIEEKSSTALSFATLGMIEKFFISEGDYVSVGQLLVRLDDESARSMLVAAEATLKQAQDGYDRLKLVHDAGSLPEIQMIDIETKLQQAQSSYAIAKNNLKNCSLYAPVSGVIGKKMAEAGEYAVVGKAVLTILD